MKGGWGNDFGPLRKNADESLLIDIVGVFLRQDVVSYDEIEELAISPVDFRGGVFIALDKP